LGTEYRNTSIKKDLNSDGNDDIILWDSDTIYVKYANQNSLHEKHVVNDTLYRLPYLTSPSQLAQLSLLNDGYISYDAGLLSRSQYFKLWSTDYAITNFSLQ
jgi:hypothetical protein